MPSRDLKVMMMFKQTQKNLYKNQKNRQLQKPLKKKK